MNSALDLTDDKSTHSLAERGVDVFKRFYCDGIAEEKICRLDGRKQLAGVVYGQITTPSGKVFPAVLELNLVEQVRVVLFEGATKHFVFESQRHF
ncbi:hypothetical protein WDW86_13355 [Bdellovibrionota bacterium FG-2]